MNVAGTTSVLPTAGSSLTVHHEPSAALYTREFLVHLSDDEVILDCSSGIVRDATGSVLPVHTRLALTPGGLRRLHELLTRALAEVAGEATPAPAAANSKGDQVLAQFPSLLGSPASEPRGTAPCPR